MKTGTGPRATPFLLSKPQLKNLRAVVDFDADTLFLKDTQQTIPLKTSHAGHYLFPLLSVRPQALHAEPSTVTRSTNKETAYETITVLDSPGSFQISMPPRLSQLKHDLTTEAGLKKIHDRLGHPSVEHLMRKITPVLDPGTVPAVKSLAEKITTNCKICDRFRKSAPHPKTSGMSARSVNQIVCIDSFEIKLGTQPIFFII